jgi:glycosyltransferase involved in cell wall biosynthesis
MSLSIIIPVFNERSTIRRLLDRVAVCGVGIQQIIVIDDGSTDGTREVLGELPTDGPFTVLRHDRNRGKGAAVATGLAHAAGDVIVIQDADLEYDPADLQELVAPILAEEADVVFGSRFAGGRVRHVAYNRQRWANRWLTWLSNLLTDLDLTDMECGYKAFRRSLLDGMTIEEPGFGFEPEITAKLAKQRPRVYEVGVSYHGRTFAEGKKITWRDGLGAVLAIIKYNLFR